MTYTPEQIEAARRRAPWSQYTHATGHCASNRMTDAERTEWHETHLYRVTWIVPDSARGNYGWRSVSVCFASEAEARAAAEAPMGVASSVTLDVSNNGWRNYLPTAKVTKLYSRKNSNMGKGK